MTNLVMVETSALVAIILEEPGWTTLAEQIVDAHAFTTCVNVFEASLAIVRERTVSPKAAYEFVIEAVARLGVAVTDYPADAMPFAAAARQRFGAGRRGLNMGDCLSYGAARKAGARLLFVGEDFARTDVNDAV